MQATILIIEDDPALRALMTDILTLPSQSKNLEVHAAGTLDDARLVLMEQGDDIDLILMNGNLPDGDAIAFCRKLRQGGFGRAIVIVSDAGQAPWCLSAGATSILRRPFTISALMEQIETVLNHDWAQGHRPQQEWRAH